MSGTEPSGEQIHNAFNEIARHLGTRSFRRQRRAYQGWLATYVPALTARGDTEQVLGMRRLVVEMLIMEAIETNRQADVLISLNREMEALGWESLERKVLVLGAMCRYFSKRMWNRLGLAHLQPLRGEVMQPYRQSGEPMWLNYLRMLDQIHQRLRARKRSR